MKINGSALSVPVLLLSCVFVVQPVAAFELDAPFVLDDEIPVVLTASRLKQPRAEVPASVTVMEAEQIRAWGARDLPELMRFVPGMTVGHSQGETTDTPVYHASPQNLMRRMQILVDGRSVYKAAIAKVNWDDIPIALEDIRRIEITRGPSSATYGANAFMAVINIISKNPEETLGTRLRYRSGNQSVSDGFISHSGMLQDGSYRLSASYLSDDGFDGEETTSDRWDDDARSQFVSGVYHGSVSDRVDVQLRAALNNSHAHIGTKTEPASHYRDTDSGFVQGRFEFDFSDRHRSHLQVYWQREDRTQIQSECVSTAAVDPDLFRLYRQNPAWATLIGGIYGVYTDPDLSDPGSRGDAARALRDQVDTLVPLLAADALSPAMLEGALELPAGSLSEDDLDITALVINNSFDADSGDFLIKSQAVCGTTDTDIIDQRADIEWQDTVIWSDTLRTVSGLNVRHDEAYSRALFNGYRSNTLYRVFANVEWRMQPWLLLNAGATYEDENLNEAAFSPRVALNALLSEQQGVRLVFSQAVRSPDMVEQQPDWVLSVRHLSPNYLGLEHSRFFMSQSVDDRGLDQERITSHELGYYHLIPSWNLELDIKVYRDELRDLISDSINIETVVVESDTRMDIEGAEMQLIWRPRHTDWVWMTLAHTDVDTLRDVEERLSPESSLVMSWQHQARSWSSTLSYFHLDSLKNGQNLYQRAELNLRKQWQVGRYRPWVGGFWQHQFERVALGHATQMYTTRNIYYLQAGLEF